MDTFDQSSLLSEDDARALVRLVADLAILKSPINGKKHHLMTDLVRLLDADAWAWILSRAETSHNIPTVVEFLHGGMDEKQFGAYLNMMQDRRSPPVEYSALNSLRLTHQHFTRTWDQLVTDEIWYGSGNSRLLRDVGFEHVMYSVRILDDDGLFSGISLKRRTGRRKFTARERRMFHIVSSEIDWLHVCSESLASVTYQVRSLTPRQRAVLTLMLEGQSSKEIAHVLGIAKHTVGDYTKHIHKHFRVNSRPELLRRFMSGDGGDLVLQRS